MDRCTGCLRLKVGGSIGTNYLPVNAHSSKSPLTVVAITCPRSLKSGLPWLSLQKQIRYRSTSLTGVNHTGVIPDFTLTCLRIIHVYVTHYGNLKGIPSQLYNWMHSTEMCLPHLTQPLWASLPSKWEDKPTCTAQSACTIYISAMQLLGFKTGLFQIKCILRCTCN